MNRKLVSFGCALALTANSFAVFAQQPVPDKGKIERRDVIISSDSFSIHSDVEPADHIALFAPTMAVPAIGMGAGQAGFQYSFSTSVDGKVVKGKPYSADAVTEHIQVLSDGNRIVRRSTASVARDSEGRTRQEATVMAFGPLAEAMRDLPRHVTIYDPVAGTTYMLNPKDKTASKVGAVMIRKVEGKPATSAAPKAETNAAPGTQRVSGGVLQGNAIRKVQPPYPAVAKAAGAEGAVQVAVTVNENGEVTSTEAVTGHPLLKEAATEAARQWKFKQTELNGQPVKVQGVLTFNFTLEGGASKEAREKAELKAVAGERAALEIRGKMLEEMAAAAAGEHRMIHLAPGAGQDFRFVTNDKKYETRKESLGKQTIEGVECEGTRNVMTIPAGEMGNELPINVVTETWYSPDLQVTVLRKFNDPRYGEDIYRLTNVNRAEPAKELFEVPSDYTIKETRGMFFSDKIGGEMQMRMREIEEKARKLQER
ncbi:MAG TPA: energy transducer TonB [Blastocatellia bacterium]|nr:energy transducer TonB [Blastocatellia bacterium]